MKTIYQTTIFRENQICKKAQKLFSVLMLLMLFNFAPTSSLIGQTLPSIILANPDYTHGYVVVQKTDSRITHYVVGINKLTYSAS